MTISRRGQLRRDGVVDVAVDVLRADIVEDTVACEQIVDGWLYPGQPERDPGLPGQAEDFAQLRRPLRIDEVDPLAIEHYPGDPGGRQRHLPDPVLQSVGGGEEQPAIQPENHHPGVLLIAGVLVQVLTWIGAFLVASGLLLRYYAAPRLITAPANLY